MKPMKSNELVQLFGVSESTIRNYVREYAQYLSPSAVGGGGQHRSFTEQDAKVLSLIIDMRSQNQSADTIALQLSALQSNNWEQLPEIKSTQKEIALNQPVADKAILSALQREADVYKGLYETERANNNALRDRAAKAENLVELYESGRLKPGN